MRSLARKFEKKFRKYVHTCYDILLSETCIKENSFPIYIYIYIYIYIFGCVCVCAIIFIISERRREKRREASRRSTQRVSFYSHMGEQNSIICPANRNPFLSFFLICHRWCVGVFLCALRQPRTQVCRTTGRAVP